MTDEIWPERIRLRDTKLYDDISGAGQRIYTTAGRGYTKVEYIRADIAEAEIERLKNLLGDPEGTIAHADSITKTQDAEIKRLRERLAEADEIFFTWLHDGRLQTFEDREAFRQAARTWREKNDA